MTRHQLLLTFALKYMCDIGSIIVIIIIIILIIIITTISL